jgi:hypothetical protein
MKKQLKRRKERRKKAALDWMWGWGWEEQINDGRKDGA